MVESFNMMKLVFLLLLVELSYVYSGKELALARYPDTAVYASNITLNIHLIGEGFPGEAITDGGALECYSDDPTCCRGIDSGGALPGRGDWFFPNGSAVTPPGNPIYRTRNHMVVRLNRGSFIQPVGVYRCEVPSAEGGTIVRYVNIENAGEYCPDLPALANGDIEYTPPRTVSTFLPSGVRFIGTIATHSCSGGHTLVGGASVRACDENAQWNSTAPSCQAVNCPSLEPPDNGAVDTPDGVSFGSVARYSCDTGHTLSGSDERTCQADGSWNLSAPTCEMVTTQEPTTESTTEMATTESTTEMATTESTTEMATTEMATTESTTEMATTESTTEMATTESTTEVTECPTLSAPPNGALSMPDGTAIGSTIVYSCDTGHTLSGPEGRTCNPEGVWSPGGDTICERTLIQLRFASLTCVNYVSTDPQDKIQAIISQLTSQVSELTSNHFLGSLVTCFTENPQVVTFRTQLSGDLSMTTSDLTNILQNWLDSTDQFILDGVGLTLNKTCDLVIVDLGSPECPNIPLPTIELGLMNADQATLISTVVVGLLLVISLVFNCLLIAFVVLSRRGKERYDFRETSGPVQSDNVYNQINQEQQAKPQEFDLSLMYSNADGGLVDRKEAELEHAFPPPPTTLREAAEIYENQGRSSVPPHPPTDPGAGHYEEIGNFRSAQPQQYEVPLPTPTHSLTSVTSPSGSTYQVPRPSLSGNEASVSSLQYSTPAPVNNSSSDYDVPAPRGRSNSMGAATGRQIFRSRTSTTSIAKNPVYTAIDIRTAP